MISGSICEGICKCVETTENAVLWGYQRGSDGLVAELHRIRDFLGLIIVWGYTLADIIIQGHTNTPSHLTSKFPIIAIGCLPVNHEWKTKGSKRGGLILKMSL